MLTSLKPKACPLINILEWGFLDNILVTYRNIGKLFHLKKKGGG